METKWEPKASQIGPKAIQNPTKIMKKGGSERDPEKNMKNHGFRGASDHAQEGSRSSESSNQHFAPASDFDAKRGSKITSKSRKNLEKRFPRTLKIEFGHLQEAISKTSRKK